jgi:hypothetical protein
MIDLDFQDGERRGFGVYLSDIKGNIPEGALGDFLLWR